MSRCDKCYTDKSLCETCRDNPIYANVPKASKYTDHPSYCKYGFKECIHDPGYMYVFDNEYYRELYGDTPPDKVNDCDHCIDGECYDDEDK